MIRKRRQTSVRHKPEGEIRPWNKTPKPSLSQKVGALGELLVRDEETKPTPKKLNQFVDGKALSPNEISFLEYLVDQFDQNLWMKKAGIRF